MTIKPLRWEGRNSRPALLLRYGFLYFLHNISDVGKHMGGVGGFWSSFIHPLLNHKPRIKVLIWFPVHWDFQLSLSSFFHILPQISFSALILCQGHGYISSLILLPPSWCLQFLSRKQLWYLMKEARARNADYLYRILRNNRLLKLLLYKKKKKKKSVNTCYVGSVLGIEPNFCRQWTSIVRNCTHRIK